MALTWTNNYNLLFENELQNWKESLRSSIIREFPGKNYYQKQTSQVWLDFFSMAFLV